MRILLTTIVFIIFASPSWSISNETLLKHCKQFANNGFESSGLSEGGIIGSTVCWSYILSAIEQGQENCEASIIVDSLANKQKKAIDRVDFKGVATGMVLRGTSAKHEDLYAVIQNFINFVENNPKEFKYIPNAENWLYRDWPCKTKYRN